MAVHKRKHNKEFRIQKEEKTLRDIIKPYLQKKVFFILSIFIFLALAILYIRYTAPVYRIQSKILVKDAKKTGGIADLSLLQNMGLGGSPSNSIENEIEVLKAKKLDSTIVSQLNLQTSLFAKTSKYDVELYGKTAPYLIRVINEKTDVDFPEKPIYLSVSGNSVVLSSKEFKSEIKATLDRTINLPYANIIISKNPSFNPNSFKKVGEIKSYYFNFHSLESIVDYLQESVNVELADKETTVLILGISEENKEKAKAIINKMVSIYNQDAVNDKNLESKKTLDFINDRISIISKELGDVENEKENFKTKNNIVDIASEARIDLQISNEARKRLMELDGQIEMTNILLNYVSSGANNQVLPTNVGLDNADASSNISLYNKLIVERNKVLENATSENPIVKELTSQIENFHTAIRESLIKGKNSLNLTRTQIERQYGIANLSMSNVPQKEKLFRSIERQQQIKENLFLLLLEKREESAISQAITVEKARIIDQAYNLVKPVAPKKIFILIGALFLGFLIPFAYVFFKDLLNSKINNRKDLEYLSAIPVLGEVPSIKDVSKIIQRNDVSPLAESFRIISTNLFFLLPNTKDSKILYVTSSVKGEGKTTISINLALSLASSKRKVVIIGADIRNPQLQRYSVDKKNSDGLVEYLYSADTEVNSIIHKSEFNEFCDIIYSGSIPPNPTELLSSDRYENLLKELKNNYDIVLVDTAPLLLVTDTLLISKFADATIYVARAGVTENEYIEFADKATQENKIRNVGFVLNDVSSNEFGYGNKYGYGYQKSEKNWLDKLKDIF